MKTSLRKLFGASIGGGAPTTLFVVALTGLIAGAPLAARAQDGAGPNVVTFRDKEPDSIVADGVLSFTDLTQANGSIGDNQTNKFQTNSNVGSIDTFFSPRQTLGSGQSWTATFTATETIVFDSVRFGGILCYNANWGGVQTTAKRADFTITAGDVTSEAVTVNWPGAQTTDATIEATVPMGQTVTLAAGETLTLVADNGNDGIVSFGFSQMEFIGSGSASQTVEWEAGPDRTQGESGGRWDSFNVTFGSLIASGDVPSPIPEQVALMSAKVEWWAGNNISDEDRTNTANVRHLVVTDADGLVVAVSDEVGEPLPTVAADATSTFYFPEGTQLSSTESYECFFVGADSVPQFGASLTSGLTVRYAVLGSENGGVAAAATFYVNGQQNKWSPAIDFTLQGQVAASGEEIVNGDSISVDFRHGDSHLVDAETDYGVVPVAGVHWNGLMSSTSSAVNWRDLEVTDSAGRTGIKLAVSANHMQDWYASSSDEEKAGMIPILRSGLADNSTVSLNVEGIPYTTYDLYLYFACDDYFNWDTNCSVTLNGEASTFYYMPEGADVAATSTSNESWGNAHLVTACELGQNVMRIANLTGESLSVAINRVQLSDDSGTRGCLTAFQIVERRHVGANSWEGTLAGVVNASAVEVQNTTTGAKAKLTELGADDVVSLSFTEQVSLTVDADVNADTLTLTGEGENAPLIVQTAPTNGGAIVAESVRLTQGTLIAGVGAFASENPITLATGTTLGVMGTGGAAFTQAVTGAGAVRIWSGSDVTLSAAFTHTGGTTVATDGGTETITTTLRYAGQPLGEGPVTVGAGGVFDLCGLACDQDIALNGGTLANTGIPNPVTPQVASVNFQSGQGTVADGATGGLLAMLGDYWTDTTGGSGTATPDFVDLANITTSGATPAPIEGLQVAWSAGTYQDGANNTSFLKGYLDDNNQRTDYFASKVTVTVPENVARCGYDLYLYYSSDAGNYGFAPVPVRANGVVTHYTYENGEVVIAAAPALTATAANVAHWGSLSEGRNTVAEGTNVMVLRGRTETQLEIGLPSYGNPDAGADRARGCIAAIQIVTKTGVLPPVYSGTLTLEGAGTLNAIEGVTFSGTLAGTGTLTKIGEGALTVAGATATDATTLAATAGELTFGEGNDLPGLTLNLGVNASVEAASAFTLGSLSGSGDFDLGDVSTLTFAGAAAEADYSGALAADGALSLVKQGTNTQSLDNLAGINALAVVAEGGTLALGSGVNALTRLETAGGNVTALPASVAYAEMASGNAAAATAATASAARPAAETATAATVSNFTLAQDGEIRYETAGDLEKFLPKGFLVAGRTYKVVLAQTLADTLAFPCSFKVQGASGVTLEPYRVAADGTLEKIEAGVVVFGNTLYLNSAAAILGDLSTLPAASHHYTFDDTVNDAATGGVNLTNDGTMTYAASDNGQALSDGTPYSNGVSPNPNGEEWTAGLFLNTASAPRNAVLAHFGVGGGDGAPVAGSVVLATGVEPGTLSVWWHDGTDYRNVLTAGLGLGGDAVWHHLLLTHSAQGFRLYVDGEEAAVAPGAYASRPGRLQVGKALGGAISGLVDGAGRFLLDDLATWPTVLREGQIALAMAEVAGKWRWNEAATPAELFGAAAQWTNAEGTAAAWPTENANTYTARATLTRTADVADLVDALNTFTARWTLLQGEPLTLTITDSTVDFPESAGTVVVDSALTLDLSGMVYGLLTQAFAENGVRLADGVWNGEITLAGAPEGYDLSVEARDDGLWLTCERYTRAVASVNFNANGFRGNPSPGDAAQVGAAEVAGLVGTLGEHWTATTGGVGSVSPDFVDYADRTVTSAAAAPIEGIAVAWNVGSNDGVYSYAANTTSYLKGYLDDTTSGDAFSRSVTLTVPTEVAPLGYDVYIYFASDSAGENHFGKFSPVSVRAGSDGATTIYSYNDARELITVSSASRDTAWGSIRDGLRTVDEGTNVMVLRGRTEETLQISIHGYGSGNSPSDGPRGSIAALQIVRHGAESAYTREVETPEAAWTETDAWTKVDDNTKAAAPEADAQVTIGIAGDTTLDMGELTALKLAAIETYGEGVLTLTFDGNAVVGAMTAGETYALVNATLDPDKVRVRVTPPTNGSVVSVSVTATGATATATAPMGTVYRATVSGATAWDSIQWTPNTGKPGTDDTAILTLTGDADLTGSASVGMMQVYAGGHAVSRANTVTAGAWHFLEDAILAVKDGQTLPTFATAPKRVRYDYTYEQNYTSTTAYETEFTAGFNASLDLAAGGLVEFSAGTVTVGTINPSNGPTVSTLIFSGTANLTMTGDQNANGLKIANGTVTFRDNARATLSRIHMRCLNASDGTLIVEGNASLSVTGSSNIDSNTNALQLGDYGGLATLILRDNATFRATNGAMLLLCNNQSGTMSQHRTTLTIEDNAKMYLAGISRARSSEGIINLNGGTLFLGNRGFYSFNNSTAPITLNFNGGTLGVWEDLTWGEAVTAACQTVTGDPTLEVAEGVTLTLEAGANLLPADGNATVRGAGTVKSALATLPALRLEDGLFVVTADAQTPGLELAGGALRLEARLTAGDFAARVPSRVAFLLGGESDAYLSAGEGRVPDLSRVTAVLTLDPDRQAGTLIPYEAPLYLGACDPAATPSIAGFMVENNVGNAIGTQTPVYVAGAQGLGLYARLTGNEVTKPHTLALTDPTTGDSVTQSVADTYGYWIFDGQVDGARLLLPTGTLNFREAVFQGERIVLAAPGAEPHLLLQAKALTLNTPLTIDLTGWEAALRDFVDSAVDNLPCSLCLIAAESLAGEGMVIPAFPDALPEAYKNALSLVATDRGVYLVAKAPGRLAQSLSVNFADRATALAAPPAKPGAYAVPVAGWNTLAGSFFSADLRVSDLAGVASIPAVGANGQNTQLSATAAGVVADASAPATLIQAWLTDDAAQTVRVANIPFARYRLALVFAADFAGAAYAPVTVGSDVYAMDAAGYTRKNVLAYAKTGALGDTAWGSTARDGLSAENPDVLGVNTLVTDVLTAPAIDIALPRLVYGRTYAGLAALQIIEAPDTATSEEGTDYTYAFTAGDENVNLANLGLTVDGEPGQTWQSGANNTLSLTVPEGLDVTLTLPLNFRARSIVATDGGSLTLQVEGNGGAVLNTLDAGGLGNLTVHFPCAGVAFTPATGLNRFEAAFDNAGETYTIADGATLSLGENSGIAVSLNGTLDRTGATTTLLVDPASTGTLRRDYPVTLASAAMNVAAYGGMTWAFKQVTLGNGTHYVCPSFLIEEGDTWDATAATIWPNSTGHTLTQTGGELIFNVTGGERGYLVGSVNSSVIDADILLSGGRLQGKQFVSWAKNSHLDITVTGTGVLAVGVGSGTNQHISGNSLAGSFGANSSGTEWVNSLPVTISGGGTLEPTAATLAKYGLGTVTVTLGEDSNLVFGAATPAVVDMTLPVVFAGTADAPTTLDPGTYGTLVLNAANTGSGALTLARGTVALADASGLGEATVTVASGAAFEARGFTGEGEGSEEARTVPVVAIKLDIPAGVGANDGTAIQEFCLYQGDDKVEWPRGTTLSGSPNWAAGGNEAINALIDSVTGGVASPGTWTNPENGITGAYTGNAKNNKWYPITNTTGTASATITIGGDGVVFDSYTLWCSDLQNRFPSAWTLSVRYKGEDDWTELDPQSGQNRPAANTESNKYRVTLRTEGGATTLDAVTGKVVFQVGSQCRAVRKVGVTGFPYVARIAGTIDLPDSGKDGIRFFLDGEEFAADAVEVDETSGLVTFREGGALVPADVTWNTANVSGTWADGVGGADGPWEDGATFINGAAVTFPAVNQPTVATVAGSVKPGTVTFNEGTTTAYYTFAGAEDAVLDLSAQTPVNVGSTTNQYIDFAAGAGTTFDVPIATSGAGVGINLPNGAVRLVGALSDNNRTATLLGSGNLNEAGQHGVWHASGDLTLMPRAGETQRLSANSGQLYGDGTIIVQGQVATDGTVSGGTVEFGGTAPAISNNTDSAYNNAFRGDFVVRDGATLDVAMMRGDGSVNVDDNPFFRTGSGAQDALYKRGEDGTHRTGFTLRNGGALRVGIRGLNAGWNNYTNADIVLNEAVVVGRNATYHPDFSARNVRQYMVHSLRMDGDGATLRIGGTAQGTASNRGLSLIQGSRLTVAGVGDAGDPADPAVDSALDEAGQPVDAETFGTLTRGISARIVTDDPTAGFKISEFGFDAADPNVYLDVGEGSALTIDAPLGAAAGTAFVKQGAGRLELTWPTIDNVVEVEVEEGALGGDAELTSGSVTVASGATVEAGLSVTELALESGATLALDPTGARQLRAGTVTFAAGGRYVISAISAPPTPAAGREPVKILSWSNVVDVSAAGFLVDDSLTTAGYGVEIRADGLYLAPAATYVRVLGTVVEDKAYALNWFDRAWHRADDFSTLVDYAPAANETANVVFIVPNSASSVGLRVTLDREVSFATVRFARGEYDENGKLIDIGAWCDGTVDYVYDLTRAEMPGERETRTYAFLPTLAYLNKEGGVETAQLTQAQVPDGYEAEIDGVTATVYLGTGGETGAINVSFTGGSEGSLSWIGTDTAPCGAVPFAGVYWNNASTQGGAGLESLPLGGGYRGYRLTPRMSGVSGDLADAPTVRYAFTAGRAVAGRAGLAAGFLAGGNANPGALGFIDASGVSAAGWAVRVDDIPFARYDLYLLFAGSGEGAATYPAVRVKPGTGAWRTYAFRNGWTAPAGSGDAWAGQAVLDEGFADGANLLHLRIEGGGTLQIVPHDGANGNNAEVGLAALQIVEIPQGEPAFYAAQGPTWSGQTWDYAATGANGASQAVRAAAWQDATPDAPHYALLDGLTRLDVDRAAALPFLRRTGSGSLELTGTAGTLSAGTLDLLEASGTVTVHEDLFVQAPNVILGDAVTLVPFPNAAADASLAWRWVYPDDVDHTATLSKKGPYALTLTQPVDNNLRIDAGTLWLTQVGNGDANYPRTISGAGTLGWAGNAFRVAFNNLPDGSADADGIFLRVASGTVTMAAAANNSLPAERTILIENGGTVEFSYSSPEDGNTRPLFTNGRFLIRNGGRLRYNATNASNLFRNTNATNCLQVPTVELQSGQFQQNLTGSGNNGTVHDVLTITSDGLSRHHIIHDNANCWASRALNVRNGQILVNSGKLALTFGGGNNASRNSIHLMSTAEVAASHGDADETCGYINVANGATFYSGYPIVATNTDWATNDATLVKIGGGVWVQAHNICQSVGYHFVTGQGQDGGNSPGGNQPYCNVEVRAGTLRLNGSRTFAQPTSGYMAGGAVQDRTVTIQNNARLDGAGDFDQHFTVEIEQGGTLAAGFPADAEWATAADGWYGTWFNDLPERFKKPTTEATAITFNGGLEFEDGAVLEVDLAKAVASTNTLVRVSGEGARVSLGSSLTVRLTNLQTAFDGPVKLTNFAVDPNSRPTVNCPEAIALDGAVQWLTDAKALGDESANATVHNLWLIASGDSYVWANQSGNWSDSRWTHQGATTGIVNGITAPEDAPKARVVADSADVALTVDQDPGEPNQPDWGLHGLVLSAAQGRALTLAQGGTLGGTVDAPTGTLNGLSIDASLWKVGPGTARVDALAKLKNGAILAVNEGTLALTRPLLRADPSAGQSANTLGADLSIEQGATLTFAFAEPTDLEEAYFEGKAIDPQALTLNGSFSGAGTLRVEGAGNQVTLASLTATTARQDGALSYSVGKGARLTLDGDTPAAVGEATPRAVTVEGTLDLASERALGATTAWTWSLGDDALVTTADDARIRGTVRLDAGAATLGRDSQQWDGDLTAEVGAGATLTFTGNIQTPEDAPASATFAKRGAGTAVIDDAGYFSPGLHVDVAEGTLRVEGTLSVTPGDGRDVVPAWTVRGGATLAIGGGTCSFSDGSLTVEAGGVLDCADGAITLNTGVDRPALLEDGARLRFGDGTSLIESAALTIPTGLRVEGRVTVEVAVDNPAGLRLSEYPLIAFGNSARQGTGTFVLGGANVTALAAAGWTLEDRGADGVYLVAFGNGQNYVWAGTAAGWLDGNAWVYNGASTPTTWVDGTSQGAVTFLDRQPIGQVDVPGQYRTVGSTGTQQVTALRSENSGGDYALEGAGGLTVQGLLLKTGASGLTFRRPVTLGNSGSLNVQGGTVTFENTVGTTDAPDALAVPVTLGQGATLAFVGGRARTLSGTLEADASAILSNADGTLTLACAVPGLTLRATGGTLALTAADQALALGGEDAPTFDLSGNAALTLGGTLSGGGTVAPGFSEGTRGVTLRWAAAASAESASVPRLGDLGEAVSTLVYAPRSGHLILDPGSLMDGAALSLENDALETTALWLGAGDGAGDEAIRLSSLTATGAACIGVEPVRALSGGSAWAGERTLTLALSGDASFGGTFVGADDAAGAIRAGLTLEKADPAAAGTPTFTYSGESTAGTVGTLTAGAGVRVSVTGEWAGAATAAEGGLLGGSGTLGAVALGAGGALSANAADVRGELAPATLTLGSLELGAGAGLEVLARVDEASGATELSLVQVAGTCRLGANDLALNVYLDLEEGAAVNNRKILGWDALDGYQRITCVVKVPDGQGGWQESDDYAVRRGDDGLYLFRTSARFWMILR